MTKSTNFDAMAFYHPDGMVPAWKHATAFGGDKGRVATLPDIIGARLAAGNPLKKATTAWTSYFTASSAEFMGLSKGGNRIVIVAHNGGPMATIDGIMKAYSHQYKDKDRNTRGGRITQKEFLELESGHYGDVIVVDLQTVLDRYEYPFIQFLRQSEALTDPLVAARLGPQAAEYIALHVQVAREWHKQQMGKDEENRYGIDAETFARYNTRRRLGHWVHHAKKSDPFLIKVGGASGCSYKYYPLEDGMAMAHLLSIGQLQGVCHSDDERQYESLTCDIGLHGWSDGTRLAGVRSTDAPKLIHPGADRLWTLFARRWEMLMKPVRKPAPLAFSSLIRIGDRWFTQYPKQGVSMDSGNGEFVVTKIEKVKGGPKTFTCEIPGYEAFFRYAVKDVEAIAPQGANAYSFGEVAMGGMGHIVPVTWYRIEADTARRLRTTSEVYNDFELLMKVLGNDSKDDKSDS